MDNLTLKDSITYIRERRDMSNKALLEMYDHLCIVEHEGLWKNPKFYARSGFKANDFINGTWGTFLSQCYQESPHWFTRMGVFFKEFKKNTRDYIIEFGVPNCSTMLSCTVDERIAIIASWRADGGRGRFLDHKYKLFPNSKRTHSSPVSLDDKRIKALEKENKELKADVAQRDQVIEDRDRQIDHLLGTIAVLSNDKIPEKKEAVK